MKTEREIERARNQLRDFYNSNFCRNVFTEEGQKFMLDRINVLNWVLEEGEVEK